MIELLVVIGIISILASLLLPALSRARDSAHQVSCLSKQKQISVSMILYTDTNRGHLPPASFGVTMPWDTLLREAEGMSANDFAIFQCPTDKTNPAAPVTRSYSMNRGSSQGSGSPGDDGSVSWAYGIVGPTPASTPWSARPSQLKRPASTIVFTERFDSDNKCGVGNACIIDKPTQQSEFLGYFPHGQGEKANYAFCDGHVESLYPVQTLGPAGTLSQARGMWTRKPGD